MRSLPIVEWLSSSQKCSYGVGALRRRSRLWPRGPVAERLHLGPLLFCAGEKMFPDRLSSPLDIQWSFILFHNQPQWIDLLCRSQATLHFCFADIAIRIAYVAASISCLLFVWKCCWTTREIRKNFQVESEWPYSTGCFSCDLPAWRYRF